MFSREDVCPPFIIPLNRPHSGVKHHLSPLFQLEAQMLQFLASSFNLFEGNADFFFEILFSKRPIQANHSQSAKCQNIHTAQNPPRSLGFFFDCSNLGLDSAGPWLSAAIKRLDCAPSSLRSPFGAKVRSLLATQ